MKPGTLVTVRLPKYLHLDLIKAPDYNSGNSGRVYHGDICITLSSNVKVKSDIVILHPDYVLIISNTGKLGWINVVYLHDENVP